MATATFVYDLAHRQGLSLAHVSVFPCVCTRLRAVGPIPSPRIRCAKKNSSSWDLTLFSLFYYHFIQAQKIDCAVPAVL